MDIFDFKRFYARSLHELHTFSDSCLSKLEEEIFYAENQKVVIKRNQKLFETLQVQLEDHLKNAFYPRVFSLSQEVQSRCLFMTEDYVHTLSDLRGYFDKDNFNHEEVAFYLNQLQDKIDRVLSYSFFPYLLESQDYSLVEVCEGGMLNFNTN